MGFCFQDPAATVLRMMSFPVFEVPFAFAHAIRDPHYHDDASLSCTLSGPVSFDPSSDGYLMGPDFVAVRAAVRTLVRDRLQDRLLFDPARLEGELPVLDAVTGLPVEGLLPSPWPFRPTVEVLSLVVATWVAKVSAVHGASVERFELWESSRSGVFLDQAMVTTAGADLRRLASGPAVESLLDVGSVVGF